MLDPNGSREEAQATLSNRRWPRHACRFGISCTYACKPMGPVPGDMSNYGADGMYFESDHAFKEGAIIYFRISDWSHEEKTDSIKPGFRSLSFGQVRWRKSLAANGGKRFGYGVKFLASP